MQELLFKKLNSVKWYAFVFLPNEIDYNLLILRDTLNILEILKFFIL